MTRADCTADGCTAPRIARGLCSLHYSRWRRGAQIGGDAAVQYRELILTELRTRWLRGERTIVMDPSKDPRSASTQLNAAVRKRLDGRYPAISSAVQAMEKRGELRVVRHPHQSAYEAIGLTPAGLRAAREVEVQQHVEMAESQR